MTEWILAQDHSVRVLEYRDKSGVCYESEAKYQSPAGDPFESRVEILQVGLARDPDGSVVYYLTL